MAPLLAKRRRRSKASRVPAGFRACGPRHAFSFSGPRLGFTDAVSTHLPSSIRLSCWLVPLTLPHRLHCHAG